MSNPGTLPFTRSHLVLPDGEVSPGRSVQIKQTRKAKHGGAHYVVVTKNVCYEMRPVGLSGGYALVPMHTGPLPQSSLVALSSLFR